jgi:hypothetical protein
MQPFDPHAVHARLADLIPGAQRAASSFCMKDSGRGRRVRTRHEIAAKRLARERHSVAPTAL